MSSAGGITIPDVFISGGFCSFCSVRRLNIYALRRRRHEEKNI